MTNRAIRRLWIAFVLLFGVLAARQAYVQIVAAPSIAARPGNPRHSALQGARGRILATDGTVLAESVGGRRVYPMGPAAAQAVGYASIRYGTSGIEDAFDAALTPADTSGDPVAQFHEIVDALEGKTVAPHGADVVTTIVPAIQQRLYGDLARYPRAAGIALDPRTGAVLAMASVPSYDPNQIDAEFAALRADPESPLLDRVLDGLYPPGSTFKIFTAAAALDSGTVTLQSYFEDPGYLQIGNFVLHDNESEATGYADLTTAFALSSNVDFAQIALKMGVDTFYDYLSRWGIGQSLEFQLPAQPAGVPPKAGIVPGELAQMGFGQGALLMSPLQMSLIGATIADGGTEPRPFVVRQVLRDGSVASVFGGGTLANPVSADAAANVTKMMIAVVQRGTGTPAALPGVTVAGKTGTATNPLGRSHAWFVAFAPAANPRVAVAVVVENVGYGATYAAPIARDVIQTALGTLGT
ncbi:MAG TPA: penicillin-binding transpeptidase domain-containing protein [Candidatus Acidoferrales bacterium]|nr:penicillin-binding transpeptidase domain-containing protein [Candidatus Acidoferrales bacterium]